GGGFLIASGLVTPLGTALLAAVMTTAILSVHIRKGDLEHRRWRRAAARAPDDGIRRQCARAQLVLDRFLGRRRQLDQRPLGRRRRRPRGRCRGIGATAGLFTLASALARKAWATQHRSSPAR